MTKPWLKIGLITVLLIFLDQLSKLLAFYFLQNEFVIIPGFFSLVYAENPGIAFGIKVPISLVIFLTPVFLALITVLIKKYLDFSKFLSILILGLIFGGAISNFIDRVQILHVVDFIKIDHYPLFNLADSFTTIGILLLLIFYKKITNE